MTEGPLPWETPASPAWPSRIRALTTRRRGPGGGDWNLADHVGDDPEAVATRRRELQHAIGVEAIQWLDQVHGVRCVSVSRESVEQVPRADAAWTCCDRLALAVLTADCVPVVIGDRAGSSVGVAHGGWRGLVGGILGNLVDALPSPASELVAWLGPAIGPQAYEVGDDVRAAVAALPEGAALVDAAFRAGGAPGKYLLDLFTLSERLLERVGVATVITARTCTFHDPSCYSFRREGRTGRMATLAWLDPP